MLSVKTLTFPLLPLGFPSACLLVRITLAGSDRQVPVAPWSITKEVYCSCPQSSSPRQAWLSAESAAHLSVPSTPLCSSFVMLGSNQMIFHKVSKLYRTSWTPTSVDWPCPQRQQVLSPDPHQARMNWMSFLGRVSPELIPDLPHTQCGLISRWWGHGSPRQKKVLFPQGGPTSAWLVG